MTNRIFSLPSGLEVVLKAPHHKALAELHDMKLYYVEGMRKDLNQVADIGCEPGIKVSVRQDVDLNNPIVINDLSYARRAPTAEGGTYEFPARRIVMDPNDPDPLMRGFIKDSVEHRQAVRKGILDKMLDPDVKIIGSPNPLLLGPLNGGGYYFGTLRVPARSFTEIILGPEETFNNSLKSFKRKAKKLSKSL